MKALLFQHDEECSGSSESTDCTLCRYEAHLKRSLDPEAYQKHRRLLSELLVEVIDEGEPLTSVMHMTTRRRNAVMKTGVRTVGEYKRTKKSILRARGFSKTTMRMLDAQINARNNIRRIRPR